MKLYYPPGVCSPGVCSPGVCSPGVCPIGIHMPLKEIGKPYDLAAVNLREGPQYQPAFAD